MAKNKWTKYVRSGNAIMRPVQGDTLESLQTEKVSVAQSDIDNGSPKIGDMIARNPNQFKDQWLVAKKYFEENFTEETAPSNEKDLGITDSKAAKENIDDLVIWGDGDTFKLISKAFSQSKGWMKSTNAMQIDNLGCVIQVTTQQGDNVAEALSFVPGVRIEEIKNFNTIIDRKIVRI